jgi:hypothetical protein
MQLTRRKLAVVLATAATAAAQQTAPENPPDDLTIARERMQANLRALAAAPVPMPTEPAFQFKA